MCYFGGMEPDPVGIRELRQHASRYVAMAKQGQRVPVTERGKLVAYLVPAGESVSVLGRLAAAGAVRPATGDIRDCFPVPPAPDSARPLSEVLAELRDEERW